MNSVPSNDRIEPYEDAFYEDEFDADEEYVDPRYRAVNRWAVLSLVFGALSFLTVFHWAFGLLPAAGIVLGLLGLRQINRAIMEMKGRPLAAAGLALSIVLGTTGASWLYVRQHHTVPAGYKEITFATLQHDKSKGEMIISQKAAELDGERVFIRGYMYPGRQVFNLREFVMVPTTSHCKFCLTKISPSQMIRVETVGDLTANYKTSRSGVGGILRVEPTIRIGRSPYLVEADVFQ